MGSSLQCTNCCAGVSEISYEISQEGKPPLHPLNGTSVNPRIGYSKADNEGESIALTDTGLVD
jgi:hypothetical protein